MEIGSFDEKSGRPLIEGKGMPIDGGIFRRVNQPGLVADTKYFENKAWFQEDDRMVSSIKTGMLDSIIYLARHRMPINENNFKSIVDTSEKHDRFSLANFTSKKDDSGTEIGGGSADVQALYTAFLIERKIKEDPDRKVWVGKDNVDGHAIVTYEAKSGGTYKFDPSKGDTGFVKQPTDNVELPE